MYTARAGLPSHAARTGPVPRRMGVASAAGMSHMMDQDQSRPATGAAVHTGAASRARHIEVDGNEPGMAEPSESLTQDSGSLVVPSGPGLGVADDASRLERVAVVRR